MKNNNNLRKLIRESIGKLLSESMTMGIDGFKYADELDNILNICHFLERSVEKYIWNGFSEKTKKADWSQRIAPDGDSAFDPVGTINFYLYEIDMVDAEKAVDFMKHTLEQNHITVGDVKWEFYDDRHLREVEGMRAPDGVESPGESDKIKSLRGKYRVVRIPIVENDAGDSGNPPNVNLSNGNAKDVFGNMLGYYFDGVGFAMDANDLIKRVDKALNELPGRKDIPDDSVRTKNNNIYSMLNGKDYYYSVLERIMEFARWAIDHGYTQIHMA